MSYILDALRKSETEHSREIPPSLATAAPSMPTPRRGFTIALVAVITVNLVLVALWITGWQPWTAASKVAPVAATTTQPPPAVEPAMAVVPVAPVTAPISEPSPAPATENASSASRMPALEVSTHVYSEDAAFSAVTINGRRRTVGDVIAPDTRLIEVTETGVVVDYRGERIAIDVLQDWR